MKLKRGFTLIELLVSIAIIALLTGIVMTNLSSSKGKARDAKRISDVGNIQLALELFYDRCREYPLSSPLDLDDDADNKCPDGITLGDFISVIPTPPSGSADQAFNSSYHYVSFDGQDYLIRAQFEYSNSALQDDLDNEHLDEDYSFFECNDQDLMYCVRPY